MRVFIAFPIEEDSAYALYEKREALRDRFPRFRWIPPENYHITLEFLGEKTAREAEELSYILEDLSENWKEIPVKSNGPGQFPPGGNPKILYEGIGQGKEILQGYHRELKLRLKEEGFITDKRKFLPHVTLCRPPRNQTFTLSHAPPVTMELHSWTIRNLSLFRSTLSPKGAIYDRLANFPLEA